MPIVVVVPASDVGPACRVARGHSGVPRVVRRERAHARRQLVANMLVCVCASAREVSVSVCTASGSISLGRSCNGRAAVGRVSLSVGLSRCRSRVCVVARAAWSCCAVICRSALERDPGLWSCRSVIVAHLCIARVKAPRTTSTRPDAHTRARRHQNCTCPPTPPRASHGSATHRSDKRLHTRHSQITQECLKIVHLGTHVPRDGPL